MIISGFSCIMAIIFWIVYGAVKPRLRWVKVTAIVFTIIYGLTVLEMSLGLLN